jgi:DNA-binding beta-propeller fold protein YncE
MDEAGGFRVDMGTGALAPVAGSPFSIVPDASGITADPMARFIFLAGNSGLIMVYQVGQNGQLTQVTGSPFPIGLQPQGITTDSTGKFLYVATSGNAVAAYSVNTGTGVIAALPGSPYPASNLPWRVVTDVAGKFLFVSNLDSGSGDVSAYVINSDGSLTQVSGSPFATGSFSGPNGLAVDPSGKFLYVALSGSFQPPTQNNQIAVFSIDNNTGMLTQVSGSPFTTGNGPVGIAVTPDRKFLYTADSLDNTISGFSIDTASGNLTSLSGSPFTAGRGKFLFVANSADGTISSFGIGSSGVISSVAGSPFTGVASVSDLVYVKPP